MTPLEKKASKQDPASADAVALKDKLIGFDRAHAAQTMVYDDQADWYETDVWSSETERKAAEEEKAEDDEANERRSVMVTIDLAGRRVVQDSAMGNHTLAGPAAATFSGLRKCLDL